MRTQGTQGVSLIECVNPNTNKWRVRWDVQPNPDEGKSGTGVNYEEVEFMHKPSIDEVKKVIIDWYNKKIDDAILRNFVWNEMPVWLSVENQFNYKAAFDLAAQTNGATLPVTFKFGTDAEPVYHEFSTFEDITDFYVKAVAFKDQVLADGWKTKDSFDFSPYCV